MLYCMLLRATACYCMLLHAAACCCMLLHATACYCMLYCMLLRATTCSTACYCGLLHALLHATVRSTTDATRRVPATNGYPPNSGGRTRTRHRVTRLSRGPEPGLPDTRYPPPGTRTCFVVTVKQASKVEDGAHIDYLSLRELQALNGTRHCVLAQGLAFVLV